ncbi:MAG: hypothetical protein ACK5CW_03440 [Verrucomicrobiota bacterium]
MPPPNQRGVIAAGHALDGSSWWSAASGVTDSSDRIEVIHIVPHSANRRFFRIRPEPPHPSPATTHPAG